MTTNIRESLNRILLLLRKNALRPSLMNGLLCFTGALSLALGMTVFLQPNHIAGGGTPGMAILICHLTNLTAGTVMILINIPLLFVGGYYLGKKFVWRTVIVVIMISAWVDFFRELIQVPAGTDISVLAAIIGGAAIGLGVGLILKGGASAGGPTIIARIVAAHSNIRPGQLILVMDAVIVVLSLFVFGAVEPALLSILSVCVTGRCVDLVLLKYEKGIVSSPAVACSESPTR